MSNYTKATNFTAKDTLPGGSASKVVKGSEFDTEFAAIETAIATKADSASPTLSGNVTVTAPVSGEHVVITGASGTNRAIGFKTAGVARWLIAGGNASAEGGANSGSDFGIYAYADNGASLGLPFSINRATGLVTLSADGIVIQNGKSPASKTATGTKGTICYDGDYIYVCVATNTWKRVAISDAGW